VASPLLRTSSTTKHRARQTPTKGTKSTYNIMKAWLTYPGPKEWCTEFPWGKAIEVLEGVGIDESAAKKLGLKPELTWMAALNNERGAEMQWWLIYMQGLCAEQEINLDEALSLCDNKGGTRQKPKKIGVKTEVKGEKIGIFGHCKARQK
jgi:hypothetical protein